MTELSGYALIGDIGGTNARLALVDLASGEMTSPIIYSAVDNPSLEDCIKQFKTQCEHSFTVACIAIACPITGDHVKMTNNPWEFSIKEMQSNLGLEKLMMINDFTAMSMCVPVLKEESIIKIGGRSADLTKPIAVYGAGTGLGVGHLLHYGNKWITLPGEGGHMDMAPASTDEDKILIALRKRLGHVSYERVLSGQGLLNIYSVLAAKHKHAKAGMTPADVTKGALSDPADQDCLEALNIFCRMLGSFGGNLALNMGTFGGVYIAGGVVTHFIDFLKASDFYESFISKGRFERMLEQIPVYVITDKLAGLKGAGAVIRQELGAVL